MKMTRTYTASEGFQRRKLVLIGLLDKHFTIDADTKYIELSRTSIAEHEAL